ncbi:hypothetical protein D3C71_1815800 [compost metagenome]
MFRLFSASRSGLDMEVSSWIAAPLNASNAALALVGEYRSATLGARKPRPSCAHSAWSGRKRNSAPTCQLGAEKRRSRTLPVLSTNVLSTCGE